MTLPRWDEDMKYELLRLKSELRPENFRVLHTPLGLGRPTSRAIEESPIAAPLPHLAASHLENITSEAMLGQLIPRAAGNNRLASIPSLPGLPSAANLESPMRRSLSRVLIIHTMDVAFVALTLALGLVLASWLIDPSHAPRSIEALKQAPPMLFLRQSHALTLVLGLYGFFSLYWLFFKLVSGSTLGESFFENFSSLQNSSRGMPAKDSGDS